MNERRSFYRNNPTIKFSKNQVIYLCEETPNNLYCIKSGVIEECNYSSDGNRQLIVFEIIGDVFPKCVAFAKTSKTLFEYRAFTDCELYIIKYDDFQSQLAYNIDFAKKMLDRLAGLIVGSSLRIDALEKPNAEIKIIYMFRYFCLLYGSSRWNGFVRIEVPLTQQDLAELTGLTRETINIEINRLTKMKIISCSHKYYTVDTTYLNKIIENDYKPELSLNLLIPHAK